LNGFTTFFIVEPVLVLPGFFPFLDISPATLKKSILSLRKRLMHIKRAFCGE